METIDLIITATNKAAKTLKEVQKQIKKLNEEADGLNEDTTQNSRKGLKKWREEIDKTVPSLKKLESAAGKVVEVPGKMLAAGLAAGAAAFFPIKQAADFEKAMQNVRAIMTNISDKTFERMKQQARELGEKTKFTATQSAEAFKFLAQAGLSANDAMLALPGTLQLAAAGGIDLATAADLATNVLAGLGLNVIELGRVNDVLAKAAASANTSVNQLGEAMKIAGPAAKGTGIEIENVVAVLGGLANAGIKGAEGGNAVKRMLILLQNPTKKARDALAEIGVETKNADGTFRGLIPVLKDLNAAELTLAQSARIFGLYTGAAAVAASNQAYEMDGLEAKLLDAAGAAKQMAISMEDNLIGAFTKMKSAIEGFFLAIAEPLLEPLQEVIEVITSLVGVMTEWVKASGFIAPAILGLTVLFSALSIAIGALGLAIGALIFSYKNLKLVVIALNPAMVGLTGQMSTQTIAAGVLAGAWTKLIAVMRVAGKAMLVALLNPYVLLAGLIGTLIVLMVRQNNQWKRTKKQAEELGAATEKAATAVGTLLQAYQNATEGSKKQTKAAKDLQEGLLKVAKENEGLSESALKAAESIDIETGKLIDGGEALRAFNVEVARKKMQTLGLELLSLEQKLNRLTKQELWGYGWGDRGKRALEEIGEEADKTRTKLNKMAIIAIQRLVALGEIDPTLGVEGFAKYIQETIPEASANMVNIFKKAYDKVIKNRLEAERQMLEDLRKTSATELQIAEENAQRRADALKKVKDQYEAIKRVAQTTGGGEAVAEQNQLWKEREAAAKQYVEALKQLSAEENKVIISNLTEQNAKVDVLLADGVIKKEEAEIRKVQLALKASEEELKVKQDVANKIKAIIGEYSKEYARANRAVELATKATEDKRLASSNRIRKIQSKNLKEFEKEAKKTFTSFKNTVKSAYDSAKSEVEKWKNATVDANSAIKDSRADTAKTLLDLERQTFTEEQVYYSKKQEAERLLAEAKRNFAQIGADATQEEIDRVLQLLSNAKTEYGSLAGEVTKEVKNAAGETTEQTVLSLDKTVQAAKAGISEVGAFELEVLDAQQRAAEEGLTIATQRATELKTLLDQITAAREAPINVTDQGTAKIVQDQLDQIVATASGLNVQLEAPKFKPLKIDLDTETAGGKIDALDTKVQTFTTYINGKRIVNIDTKDATKEIKDLDKEYKQSSYLNEDGEEIKVYTNTAQADVKKLDDAWKETSKDLKKTQTVSVDTSKAITNMKALYGWATKTWAIIKKIGTTNTSGTTTTGGTTTTPGFASGVVLPGYGGGDTISANLESGEAIIPKEVVKFFGKAYFKDLINMKFKPQISIPKTKSYKATSNNTNMGHVMLGVGQNQYPVSGDVNVLEQLKLALTRENLVRVR